MFVAMLVAWVVAALRPAAARPVLQDSSEPLGLVLGAAAIFVGRAHRRRPGHVGAGQGGRPGPRRQHPLLPRGHCSSSRSPWPAWSSCPPSVTPLLTALWVIAITNAVNLIDGLDGLAAGVVAIASGALAVYGLRLMQLGNLPPDNIGPLIAVITCGICLGFLPSQLPSGQDLHGRRRRAVARPADGRLHHAHRGRGPSRVTSRAARPTSSSPPCSSPSSSSGCPSSTWPSPSSAGPANRTGFHTPDKDHLHHRLLRLGHGHRRSVLILWAWTARPVRASSSSRCSSRASTPSSPSARRRSGWCSTPSSIPGLRRRDIDGPALVAANGTGALPPGAGPRRPASAGRSGSPTPGLPPTAWSSPAPGVLHRRRQWAERGQRFCRWARQDAMIVQVTQGSVTSSAAPLPACRGRGGGAIFAA